MIPNSEITMPDFCNRRHPFHFATALHLLQKIGISLERIELLAAGEFENYKGEIREQSPDPGTSIDTNTRIVLKVGFPSAVDLMPYQFFYGLRGVTARSSDWELQARQFMAPFDAAYIRRLADSAYQSLKFNFGFLDAEHIARYLKLFALDDEKVKDPEDAILWMTLMPGFHMWAGNAEMVAEILSIMFGFKFKILENIPSRQEIPENLQYRLGSGIDRVGRGVVIGRTFEEYESGYFVIISGVKATDLDKLLPGGRLRKNIEAVLDFSMPGNTEYQIKIKIDRQREPLAGKGYLGYSSYI
jgi:hypothetical protein